MVGGGPGNLPRRDRTGAPCNPEAPAAQAKQPANLLRRIENRPIPGQS
jgi:hypothetical protein